MKAILVSLFLAASMGWMMSGCMTIVEPPEAAIGSAELTELRAIPFPLPIKTEERLSFRVFVGPILVGPDGQKILHAAKATRTLSGPIPADPAGGVVRIIEESRALLYRNGEQVLPVVYGVEDLSLNDVGDYAARFAVIESNNRKWSVVVNGRTQSGEWFGVEAPELVSWAPAWANVVKMNPGAQILPKKYFVTMNNRIVSRAYDFMRPEVTFVRDSPRVAFAAMRDLNGPWAIYVTSDGKVAAEEKVTGDFDDITSPLEQSGSRALVFAAARGKAWSLYVGERSIADGYDEIERPLLSPDGTHVACVARGGGSWVALLDGRPVSARMKWIGDMAFSPDGSRLVYVAYPSGPGKGSAVLMSGAEVLSPRLLDIRQPRFSPDGRRIAFQGSSGRQKSGVVPYEKHEFVMVDGERVTPLFTDSVGFRFLANGVLAYAGYDERSQCLRCGEVDLP